MIFNNKHEKCFEREKKGTAASNCDINSKNTIMTNIKRKKILLFAFQILKKCSFILEIKLKRKQPYDKYSMSNNKENVEPVRF